MNSSTTVNIGKHSHTDPHPAPLPGIGSSGFEPLLDSEEAAALLKIHPKTLQKLARTGKVDAIQIGKLWRFRASALNRWLEEIAR
jgi:excisionase family DNA binding protein